MPQDRRQKLTSPRANLRRAGLYIKCRGCHLGRGVSHSEEDSVPQKGEMRLPMQYLNLEPELITGRMKLLPNVLKCSAKS